MMNAWIDLWSAGMLKSGLHYQCVAYGGSLLANAEFMWEDEDCEKLSNLLRLNRRCVVLIDSDLSSGKAELRPTKTRIQKETKATGGICWITAGKEIASDLDDRAVRLPHPQPDPAIVLVKILDIVLEGGLDVRKAAEAVA